MNNKLAQKTRRQQNEALQRKTKRGRFHVDYPRSIFQAPSVIKDVDVALRVIEAQKLLDRHLEA